MITHKIPKTNLNTGDGTGGEPAGEEREREPDGLGYEEEKSYLKHISAKFSLTRVFSS